MKKLAQWISRLLAVKWHPQALDRWGGRTSHGTCGDHCGDCNPVLFNYTDQFMDRSSFLKPTKVWSTLPAFHQDFLYFLVIPGFQFCLFVDPSTPGDRPGAPISGIKFSRKVKTCQRTGICRAMGRLLWVPAVPQNDPWNPQQICWWNYFKAGLTTKVD